jgi:2-C-methyl-D-erythritol 4-phosphate cytidylyltransferase
MGAVKVGLVVPAAGRGQRLGGDTPKAFVTLGGEPIILHTLRRLAEFRGFVHGIVLVPASHVDAFRRLVGGCAWPFPLEGIAGGAERQQSVERGLDALGNTVDIVVVHDAVRPFASAEMVAACIDAAREHGAALTGVPVHDTIKRIAGGTVVSTVNRRELWVAQTPQAFRTSLLRHAHRRAAELGYSATDDGGLVEWAGTAPRLVSGDPLNLKITTPADLRLAESLLAAPPAA